MVTRTNFLSNSISSSQKKIKGKTRTPLKMLKSAAVGKHTIKNKENIMRS
jgi:hypothetical protein